MSEPNTNYQEEQITRLPTCRRVRSVSVSSVFDKVNHHKLLLGDFYLEEQCNLQNLQISN